MGDKLPDHKLVLPSKAYGLIEALLDYIQDDGEWKNFHEHLKENGSRVLSDDDLRIIDSSTDTDDIYGAMCRAAEDLEETHCWAMAHRLRTAWEGGVFVDFNTLVTAVRDHDEFRAQRESEVGEVNYDVDLAVHEEQIAREAIDVVHELQKGNSDAT